MEQKKVSALLTLAGAAAAIAGSALFFVYGPIAAVQCRLEFPEAAALFWPGLIWLIAIGIVYWVAMGNYFLIVRRIGRDQSFCRENAKGLIRIAYSMGAAGGMWLLGIALPPLLWQIHLGPACIALAMAALASCAMGVLAWGLGKLLDRAVQLKEENDLTV